MSNSILPAHKTKFDKKFDEFGASRLEALDLGAINTLALTCPAQLLPHLAASFDVNTQGTSEAAARRLIMNAFKVKNGTRGAIESALKAFFGGCKIEEWDEYGGEPYFFRVTLKLAGEPWAAEMWDKAEGIVAGYKNVRSVMEGWRVELETAPAKAYAGSACVSGESIEIYPYQGGECENEGSKIYLGAAASGSEIISIYADWRLR